MGPDLHPRRALTLTLTSPLLTLALTLTLTHPQRTAGAWRVGALQRLSDMLCDALPQCSTLTLCVGRTWCDTDTVVGGQVLRQLQAVSMDADEEVLPLGAVLSQLPVDLPMGKLLVLSTLFNLEDELMTIAAVRVRVRCLQAQTSSNALMVCTGCAGSERPVSVSESGPGERAVKVRGGLLAADLFRVFCSGFVNVFLKHRVVV